MEKKVYQIQYAIKDKETKRVRNRRIYNIMATDLNDAVNIIQERWLPFEIEILNILNEWNLEDYIVAKDNIILLYRKNGKVCDKW